MLGMKLLLLWSAWLGSYIVTAAEIVNVNILRAIDVSFPVVKVSLEISATGVNGRYSLVFPFDFADHISYISVIDSNSAANLILDEEEVSNGRKTYHVATSCKSCNLKATIFATNVLTPYPASIGQSDNQFVLYNDSHYFFSPYKTLTQTTTVRTGSSNVVSYTPLDPASLKSSRLTFGPYEQVSAFESSAVTIHYQNNKPFAQISRCVRELEISHWGGNVAVEEAYDIEHTGAKLNTGFSRIDYSLRKSGEFADFDTLKGRLNLYAKDIYYRDQIGNISSSTLRDTNDYKQLDITTRFPLFGGWKTQFYLLYNIDAGHLLTKSNDEYSFKFDFHVPFEDVWVSSMTNRIILPEGATNIKVSTPFEVNQKDSKRFTYLDSTYLGGRPVIVLTKSNLVEAHRQQFEVTYSFDSRLMLFEPMMITGTFLTIYMAVIIASRLSNGSKQAATKQKND